MVDPKTLDISKDGSPWVRIDKVGNSEALDVSKDGSPWTGYYEAPQAGNPWYYYAQQGGM